MSIAGITLALWAIIEGPAERRSSPEVLGAGAAGLAVLAAFAVLERHSAHPMLQMGFFRDRAFGAAIPSVMTVSFGLFGALFVLTQFLQFSLGYSPLAAGVRVLPAAAAVMLIAPLSAAGVRLLGPKVTMACGLALIAAGLWLVSGITVSTGYGAIVAGLVALGAGAGSPCRPQAAPSSARCRASTRASPQPPTPPPSRLAAPSASRWSAACSAPVTPATSPPRWPGPPRPGRRARPDSTSRPQR